jgi:hypothetical protein
MTSYLEERFPHLIPELTKNWGKPEDFKDYFFNLVFDSRGGRTGWPPEAWEELSFLESLHKLAHQSNEIVEEEPVNDSIKWVS